MPMNRNQSTGLEFIPEDKKKKAPVREKTAKTPPSSPQGPEITRVRGGIDRTMLVLIIIMVSFGSVMVFSASYPYALDKYGDSMYFVWRQLAFLAVGFAAMFVASWIEPSVYEKYTPLFFGIVCLLLVAVLFAGFDAGGAQRWIGIPGTSFGVQPSEFMKLAIAMILAKYYSYYQKQVLDKRSFKTASLYGIGLPLLIIVGVCVLVMLEKHVSGTIIIFAIGMMIVFCGGARKIWFGVAGVMAVCAASLLISFSAHARLRVDTWLHPENYSAQNEIWQTIHGLNAVGSGGFLGVGLGQSRLKHRFVSMPQNDFIYSIIAEELGFVGSVAVIALFAVFVWRGFVIANRAPDPFMKLTAIGIVGKVGMQAFLNIAVVTNTIPNTGITLPFFSYGGSALVILMAEMGLLLSISRYSYQDKL
ncbi:MAG: cell division protein FtsW [Ruminococcaceae bacterium]|nr:cell division protein FtsW [Oscillospiraceae bacterium]